MNAGFGAVVGSVVDTTELRWFLAGPPTRDVLSWFTRAGTAGLVEERCDTYLMDDRIDIGVKRRHRETLEVKVRRSVGERLVLNAGPAGRLETWRKWSPADDPIGGTGGAAWLDVHKKVVKRRFSVEGDEITLAEGFRAMTGAGCDVEVTSVVVRGIQAWTFAFAAFGPTTGRRDAIVASWQTLGARSPEQFGALTGRSNGYPEWLHLIDGRSATFGGAE